MFFHKIWLCVKQPKLLKLAVIYMIFDVHCILEGGLHSWAYKTTLTTLKCAATCKKKLIILHHYTFVLGSIQFDSSRCPKVFTTTYVWEQVLL